MQTKVLVLAHPASIMRGGWGREPFQIMYLRRLRQWALEDKPIELVDVDQPPPKANLFPTLPEVLAFLSDPRCQTEGLAIDLEAAGPYPRCLGLMLADSEDYICIHFRRQGGGICWSYTDLCTITESLTKLLEDPTIPKIFQNGQAYDVPELEALGFTVNGYAEGGFDPMSAHRYMYGECPADLQTLGIAYGGLVAWKRLVREEDEGEGK